MIHTLINKVRFEVHKIVQILLRLNINNILQVTKTELGHDNRLRKNCPSRRLALTSASDKKKSL